MSLNWTVPTGVPAPGATAFTCAVKVTACPSSEGLSEDVTAVRVSAGCTVCPPASEPLLSRVSGLLLVNAAVTGWLPTAREEVWTDAWPLPSTFCGPPRAAPSAWNCTVPATPPPPCLATVAVKVTSCR